MNSGRNVNAMNKSKLLADFLVFPFFSLTDVFLAQPKSKIRQENIIYVMIFIQFYWTARDEMSTDQISPLVTESQRLFSCIKAEFSTK